MLYIAYDTPTLKMLKIKAILKTIKAILAK